MKKCPKGTQRLETGAKELSDCRQCPQGSASPNEASTVCIVCGAGSTNNEDLSTCQCKGLFRSWQETTNSCVCMPGYKDPVATTAESSNVLSLDCIPILIPSCDTSTSFVNEFGACVEFSWCTNYYKCKPGQGSFETTLNSCFCKDVPPALAITAMINARHKSSKPTSPKIIRLGSRLVNSSWCTTRTYSVTQSAWTVSHAPKISA